MLFDLPRVVVRSSNVRIVQKLISLVHAELA